MHQLVDLDDYSPLEIEMNMWQRNIEPGSVSTAADAAGETNRNAITPSKSQNVEKSWEPASTAKQPAWQSMVPWKTFARNSAKAVADKPAMVLNFSKGSLANQDRILADAEGRSDCRGVVTVHILNDRGSPIHLLIDYDGFACGPQNHALRAT
jgi:hypothetical protein